MNQRARPFLPLVRPLGIFLVVAGAVWLLGQAYGPQSVRVNVRWRADVSDVARQALESELQLSSGQYIEGATWTYQLERPSRAVIRALVLHEAVEDTAHLHRTQFRPEIAQYHTLWFGVYAFLAGLGAVVLDSLAARLRTPAGSALARLTGGSARLGRLRWPASMTTPGEPGVPRPRVWTATALAVLAPAVLVIVAAIGGTPYPMRETVGILDDVTRADSPLEHVDPARRSWYRPLFFLTWDAAIRATSSLDDALAAFRVLEIVPIALLVGFFVGSLRPATLRDAAAAVCAAAVLLGVPAFRDNLELPLLYTLVAMPMVVVVWHLLESPRRASNGVVFLLLAAVAIGFKEQGLVLVPLVALGPFLTAPGSSRLGAAAVALLAVGYTLVRWSTRGELQLFEQDITIGFTTWSAGDATARFRDSFLWVHAYNAVSVVSNLLFAEPTGGRFRMIEHAIRGALSSMELIDLASSAALSGLITWWAVVVGRRDWRRGWTRESRLVVFLVVACIASGVLAFSYPRDRHGAMALVLYAAASYYAIRLALERIALMLTWRHLAAGVAIGLLAVCWQLRLLGTVYYSQWRAQQSQYAWIVDRAEERAERADRDNYLAVLDALEDQGLAEDIARPRGYPAWLRRLFDLGMP
jgi:hypothetical protein